MEKKEINVYPVPNGYVLKFGKEEYMYYGKAALLEGFMYHVGLEELGAVDAETIRNFLTAAIVWKEQGETVKELLKTKKENETLRSMVTNLKKQVKRLCEKNKKENGDDEDGDDEES